LSGCGRLYHAEAVQHHLDALLALRELLRQALNQLAQHRKLDGRTPTTASRRSASGSPTR